MRESTTPPTDREQQEPTGEPTPLQLSANARIILDKRYLERDASGHPTETPEALFRRVARTVAEVDGTYEGPAVVDARERVYYDVMARLEFLPNSPTLMNAGRPLGQLSACFVLPVGDSMEEIFDSVKHAALIHKSGGGTGFAFSRLRPANDTVQSTHGISSGPVSFMRVFDAATETIKQGGTRRGANMGVLRVDHPDILDFIRCKGDGRSFANFNISVGITHAFMEALAADARYPLMNPRTGAQERMLSARMVWEMLAQEAWTTGEPGVVFLDRINADNPTPALGAIEGTNPCGEQPLLPYEACNLGSVNLGRMVRRTGDRCEIDYARLARTIHTGGRFLDNIIDANRYPLPETDAITRGNRKIGLGVMGFADLLLALEIPYDSEGAVELAEELARFIRTEADTASRERAAERGPFPNWRRSIFAEEPTPPRNATRTTVAPTGTISIIADASSGVEPLYGVTVVRRNILDGVPMTAVHPHFVALAQARGFYSDALLAAVADRGTLADIPGIPPDVRRLFKTALEIAPEWHVRMQAAFQRHTDNGVSKTINLPATATVTDVRQAYQLAYDLGCKGVTIYRDRSRESQVLHLPGSPPPGEPEAGRPPVLSGHTHQVHTPAGPAFVTVNRSPDGHPAEVFAVGPHEGREAELLSTVCRLATLCLHAGMQLEALVEELQHADALSHAIGDVLQKYVNPAACPACGAALTRAAGCETCAACGFTPCP